MEISGNCKREYKLTLDGESFDLILASLGWAGYFKTDTIKSLEKDQKVSEKKCANQSQRETATRHFESTISSHKKDIEKMTSITKELVRLK